MLHLPEVNQQFYVDFVAKAIEYIAKENPEDSSELLGKVAELVRALRLNEYDAPGHLRRETICMELNGRLKGADLLTKPITTLKFQFKRFSSCSDDDLLDFTIMVLEHNRDAKEITIQCANFDVSYYEKRSKNRGKIEALMQSLNRYPGQPKISLEFSKLADSWVMCKAFADHAKFEFDCDFSDSCADKDFDFLKLLQTLTPCTLRSLKLPAHGIALTRENVSSVLDSVSKHVHVVPSYFQAHWLHLSRNRLHSRMLVNTLQLIFTSED